MLINTQQAKLDAILEPVIVGMGLEYVGSEQLSQGDSMIVRVFIDKPDGVSVGDLSDTSHQLGGVLDVEDVIHQAYRLEVSSPGLNRPLYNEHHFTQCIGSKVKIRLSSPLEKQRNFVGYIINVKNGVITINTDGNDIELTLTNMVKANIIYEFDKETRQKS